MGYKLEITRNKKGNRIDKESVEELIKNVQVLSEHANSILDEVQGRDDVIENLEGEIEHHIKTISDRDQTIQDQQIEIQNYKECVDDLSRVIEDQQSKLDKLDDKNNKIERLESDVQHRYDEVCKLKEELENVIKEKNKLEKKINIIIGAIDDEK